MEFIRDNLSVATTVAGLYFLFFMAMWWYTRRRKKNKTRKFVARVTGEED